MMFSKLNNGVLTTSVITGVTVTSLITELGTHCNLSFLLRRNYAVTRKLRRILP